MGNLIGLVTGGHYFHLPGHFINTIPWSHIPSRLWKSLMYLTKEDGASPVEKKRTSKDM